jgi:hypothetical protein
MTTEGKEWRQRAELLGCRLYYAPESDSSSAIWGYAPDEDEFQRAKLEQPDCFVLNDSKAYAPAYPLMLHRCGCWRLRGATTRNWPKIVSANRQSIEQWVRENRPDNPIFGCKTCLKNSRLPCIPFALFSISTFSFWSGRQRPKRC